MEASLKLCPLLHIGKGSTGFDLDHKPAAVNAAWLLQLCRCCFSRDDPLPPLGHVPLPCWIPLPPILLKSKATRVEDGQHNTTWASTRDVSYIRSTSVKLYHTAVMKHADTEWDILTYNHVCSNFSSFNRSYVMSRDETGLCVPVRHKENIHKQL